MKITLISLDAPQAQLEIESKELPLVLGRGAEADVQFPDPWVSRSHCRLDLVDGVLMVRDLCSRHGTFVNAERVKDSPILPNDRLSLGSLHFAVCYAPETELPLDAARERPAADSTTCYEPTA